MTTPARPLTPEERLRRLTQRRLQREGLAPAPELPALPPPATVPRAAADVTAQAPPPAAFRPQAAPSLERAPAPITLEERLRAVVPKEPFESVQLGLSRAMAHLPGPLGEASQTLADRLEAARAREAEVATSSPGMAILSAPAQAANLVASLETGARLPIVGPVLGAENVNPTPTILRGLNRAGQTVAVAEEQLPTTVAGRLARAAGVEGARFGALEGTLAAARGEDPATIAAETGRGLAGGAAFGGGAQTLEEVGTALARAAAFRELRRWPRETAFAEARGGPAGMPEHVAQLGAQQQQLLEVVDQDGAALAPSPRPPERPLLPREAAAAGEREAAARAETPPFEESFAGRQAREAVPPTPTFEEFATRVSPEAGERVPMEPPRPLPQLERRPIPPAPAPRTTIELPEGAPEILGGTREELAAREAARAAEPGVIGGKAEPEGMAAARRMLRGEEPAVRETAPAPYQAERKLTPAGPGGRFYSRVEQAIQTAPFEKGTPEQWDAWFKKVPGGTSREELELTTLRPFLEELSRERPQLELGAGGEARRGPPVISRADLLQRIQPVGISEKVKAETPLDVQAAQQLAGTRYSEANRHFRELVAPLAEGDLTARVPAAIQHLSMGTEFTPPQIMDYVRAAGLVPPDADANHPIFRAAIAMNTAAAEDSRLQAEPSETYMGHPEYREYTLPGGTNYREIVLTQTSPVRPLGPQGMRPARERVSAASAAYTDALEAIRRDPTFPPPGHQTHNELLQWAAARARPYQPAEWREPAQAFIDTERELSGATEAIPLQPEPYESSHWRGVKNPVAHLRVTDREIGGKPALLIEEVQSDVHQQGREEGYADPERLPELHNAYLRASAEFSTFREQVRMALRNALRVDEPQFVTIPNPPWTPGHPDEVLQTHVRLGDADVGEMTLWPAGASTRMGTHLVGDRGWVFNGLLGQVMNASTHTRNVDEALSNLRETFAGHAKTYTLLQVLHNESGLNKPPIEGLPGDTAVGQAFSALNHWRTLEVKENQARIEWEAARSGPPKLAFARTEDWAGLVVRRAIDEAVRTGKEVLGWTTGEQQAERYNLERHVSQIGYFQHPDGTYDLTAVRLGGDQDYMDVGSHIAPAKLDEYVGLEVADRIRAGVGRPATEAEPSWRYLEGLNLRVGGGGMKKFYDEILPKIIQAQFKRLGAKVTPARQPMETGTGLTVEKIREAYQEDVRRNTEEEALLDKLDDKLYPDIRATDIQIPESTWRAALEEVRFELQDAEVQDEMANLSVPGLEGDELEAYLEQAQEQADTYAADRWGRAEMKVRALLDARAEGETTQVWTVPIAPETAKTVIGQGQVLMEPAGVYRLVEPSPWTRGLVGETEAAYGGEEEADRATARLTAEISRYYAKRSETARTIVEDLRKGYAAWLGRPFPSLADMRRAMVSPAEYQDALNGMAAMMQAIRSPFYESLAMIGIRDGVIVTSHVVTSGKLGTVTLTGPAGVDLGVAFMDEAAAAGATEAVSWHNHPSGNPQPSTDDLNFWARMQMLAEQRGLASRVHGVIDDETMSLTSVDEADGGRYALMPRFLPYHFDRDFSWLRPATPELALQVTGPADVASLVAKAGRAEYPTLLHFNSRGILVGLEPVSRADLALGRPVEELLGKATTGYGTSWSAIAVASEAHYRRALELTRNSPVAGRMVGDIIWSQPGGRVVSARAEGAIDTARQNMLIAADDRFVISTRVAEPGAVYDPVVQGSRPIVVPRGLPADGPPVLRETIGPVLGQDNLPNTAAILAQQAIDASEKLGLTPSAQGVIGKLVSAFAGTRLEQIGPALHLLLVDYERQRIELQQQVQQDVVKESLDRSAVEFLAGLPYFNEFRAVNLLGWLRDKLPRAIGGKLGITPDRQALLFDAAEAIAEFDPHGAPVFRDVLERSGELDDQAYGELLQRYGHPERLALEVRQLEAQLEGIRGDMAKPRTALSPAAAAVERYRVKLRAKQGVAKAEARQVVAQLRAEIAAQREEVAQLKGLQALHAKEGILEDDAAAALPAELKAAQAALEDLRARLGRFQALAAGRSAPGPALDPKEAPAAAQAVLERLARWRQLRGQAMELEEVRRGRWSMLRAFDRAYQARAKGQQAGQVRVTAEEAKRRWDALTPREQEIIRRFAIDRDRAHRAGLEAHVNRELAKLEYGISSDIEAYVHHYGFEDEGAMALFFGSNLRRKKAIAGARMHRMNVEGFTRHLEGARLHGGIPLALQRLQNEYAEALERVMFTTPDPNLARPLAEGEDPPEGFSATVGRHGEFKGQRFAVANPVYKELEFFQQKPPAAPTTDERANAVWEKTKTGLARVIYYWSLNQLISLGTAARNLYGGATQYATYTAELLAGGDFAGATRSLLSLARALSPRNVRALPPSEFGASSQTMIELHQARGAFRALMNAALIPFGMVENYFKRALTLTARELMAQRTAAELVADGTLPKAEQGRAATRLFDNPTFEMRAFEEMVRDAFAYNYNNVPLALRQMNKTALGKALIPYPIWGYKFARHVGRYSGAAARLARGKGRPGDLQKVIAALLIFGIPAVLTWMGDDEGQAKAVDPGLGVKYDFDRSGRVYLRKNDRGNEEWLLTRAYGFYGLGAVLGHTMHDLVKGEPQPLAAGANYLADFYSVGPGFQAADWVRGTRNRFQTYRNSAAIAADMTRSFIPFHRPLEAATRIVDPTKRKQETFLEGILQAVPVPEADLERLGLTRGEPRTARGGRELVPAYDPWLEFLKEFAGVNIKEIDPVQANQEYRDAAARAQSRSRRSAQSQRRLEVLEQRRRTREEVAP